MELKERLSKLMITGGQIATSAFPAPIAAIFNALLSDLKDNIYQKRMEKWQQLIVDKLKQFEDNIDNMLNSESFATAVIKTSQQAVQTQSEEKMTILANVLFNTYTSNVEEDKMLIFLHLVEKYTCTHIRILKYFHDDYKPEKYPLNLKPSINVVIKMDFKDMDYSYLKKIINDLQNDYLIDQFNENAPALVFGKGLYLVTELGKEFYDFIKEK